MTATADPLAPARAAAAQLHEQKKIADFEAVAAWRTFLANERQAHVAVIAGELEREAWAALWKDAPDCPTAAQYDNAAEIAALVAS